MDRAEVLTSEWAGQAPGSIVAARLGSHLTLAAWCSMGAGLIHAAAAGAHAEHKTLAAGFSLVAAVQLGWGVWALGRSAGRRLGIMAGMAISAFAIGAWIISRTVGLGDLAGSEGVHEIGLSDATAAALAGIALAGAAWALLRRDRDQDRTARAPFLARRIAAVSPLLALVAAVPAVAMAGQGGHAAGGHGDSHTVASADVFDQPNVSAVQKDRARKLVAETQAAAPTFADPSAARALGYRSIGDGFTGYEHFVNSDYQNDDTVLDPKRPESLVFTIAEDGTRTFVSAMYILPPGSNMEDVPDVGGALTPWHDHQDLCWDDDGYVVGQLQNGVCKPSGTFRATAPMLHVWVVDNSCGPFAGIETGTNSMPGACVHGHGTSTESSDSSGAPVTTIPQARRDVMGKYIACLRIRGASVVEGPTRLALATLNFNDPTVVAAHGHCSALMPPSVAKFMGLPLN